jgi:peroxiredoxin
MKVTAIIFLFVMQSKILLSQKTANLQEVLAGVWKAQALTSINYSVWRRDTLVTDDIRTMKGDVIISVDKADAILGFRFWAKMDGESSEKIYDGHVCYETDTNAKTYKMLNSDNALQHMFYSGSGHLVIPDLVKLDTTKSSSISVQVNKDSYDIIINYPDLTAYNVIKRRKVVTIDKLNMLPVSVRQHQETDGKVQDLYFHITTMAINPAITYNFTVLPFLKEYTYLLPGSVNTKPKLKENISAPYFNLQSFDGTIISSDDFKGKVVLLDFWEVWCGPCIESIPRVMALYDKYHARGLYIYGITNDLKQLSSAKAFAKRKAINFPLLAGNEQFKKDYQLNAVPMYVLIDRKGIIREVSVGYTDKLERDIAEALK